MAKIIPFKKEQPNEPMYEGKVVEFSLEEFNLMVNILQNMLWEVEEKLGDSSIHEKKKDRLETEKNNLLYLLAMLEN